MKNSLTILFLGGAKRVSMAEELIRAGKECDCDIRIYSHELTPNQPIASVGEVIVGGKYSSPKATIELNEIIKGYHVDVVLPFVDPSINIAVNSKLKYPDIYIPTSDKEAVNNLFDKVLSAAVFEEKGFPIPKTYTPADIQFPAIMKPRTGSASKGIIVVNNNSEFEKIDNKEAYLIQEYISNREEYTLDCFVGMNDHEIKCIVPRIRIHTIGGEVSMSQTCRIPELISMGKKVITELNLIGAITLQFLYDKDSNRFMLMEINPRLGGGVICSIKAGADIAKMIISEALGNKVEPVKVWRDGALMTRYMKEVMFYNDGIK